MCKQRLPQPGTDSLAPLKTIVSSGMLLITWAAKRRSEATGNKQQGDVTWVRKAEANDSPTICALGRQLKGLSMAIREMLVVARVEGVAPLGRRQLST